MDDLLDDNPWMIYCTLLHWKFQQRYMLRQAGQYDERVTGQKYYGHDIILF